MNNPAKTFEFIRLYPTLAADPSTGRIGEVYYNTLTKSMRVCVRTTPVLWKAVQDESIATTATSAGTTTLTILSAPYQQFTGTLSHTVVLPDATTLINGFRYTVQNRSSAAIVVNANGGTRLAVVPAGAERAFHLIDISTAAGTWDTSAGVYGEQDSPLKLYASSPATALLNIAPSSIVRPNGSVQSVGPIQSATPVFVASTVNFQTQATTGGTFSVSWPTSTVGRFRRAAFTMLPTSVMRITFSAEALTVGALADPATLYDPSGSPVGFIDF